MANDNINYQLGLLHLVHLLVTVDGHIDDRERAAIDAIRREEKISEKLCADFESKVESMKEQQIYSTGINLLSNCTDDERLAAFVHLYKLAEADSSITNKEVRFLLYGLKLNNLSFEDVILSANMSGKL
ncbi:MAG: hypothetical protein ACKOE6_12935 [Flammeovirgaceae bacterium]